MEKVDFFLLSTAEHDQLLNFACRLTEKAFHSYYNVFILTENQQDINTINQLLWSFRADSFVPHNIVDTSRNTVAQQWHAESGQLPPVLVGKTIPDINISKQSVLVCLELEPQKRECSFTRVCHIISSDEDIKAQGRILFTQYKKQGIIPEVKRQ